jgi:transposase
VVTYEYAGFKYEVTTEDGDVVMTPIPGQHHAAWKERHRRAAKECYLEEGRHVRRTHERHNKATATAAGQNAAATRAAEE